MPGWRGISLPIFTSESSLPEARSRLQMALSDNTATKTKPLPSGLQLGIACRPGGLFSVVTWRSCEPSAATVQIVDAPAPPEIEPGE